MIGVIEKSTQLTKLGVDYEDTICLTSQQNGKMIFGNLFLMFLKKGQIAKHLDLTSLRLGLWLIFIGKKLDRFLKKKKPTHGNGIKNRDQLIQSIIGIRTCKKIMVFHLSGIRKN